MKYWIAGVIAAIILLAAVIWYMRGNGLSGTVWVVPNAFLKAAKIDGAKIGATFDDTSIIMIVNIGGKSFAQIYDYTLEGEEITIKHSITSSTDGSTCGAILPDGIHRIKIAPESLLIYDNDRTLLSLWTTS